MSLDIVNQTVSDTFNLFYCLCFEQAVFQDGESVGEPKFQILWSKVHKRFRARPVAAEKDYGYMMAVQVDVFSSVSDSNQDMDMRVNQTQIMAPLERPSRSQIIFQPSSFHASSSCIITKHMIYTPVCLNQH